MLVKQIVRLYFSPLCFPLLTSCFLLSAPKIRREAPALSSHAREGVVVCEIGFEVRRTGTDVMCRTFGAHANLLNTPASDGRGYSMAPLRGCLRSIFMRHRVRHGS